METQKFKTNIKCAGCVTAVTPFLNKTLGENTWNVNLEDAQKTLTVPADADEAEVVSAMKEAGYQAEKV